MGQATDPSSVGKPPPHVNRMQLLLQRLCNMDHVVFQFPESHPAETVDHETEDELCTLLWQKWKGL